MSNINVTKKPKYSIEKLSNGQTMVRYTAEIDGRPVVSEYTADNIGNALSGARTRFDKTIRNRYEIADSQNLDNLIGTPLREDPGSDLFRRVSGEDINPNASPEQQQIAIDLATTIDGDSLTEDEKSSLEKERVKAENQDEKKAGIMVKGRPKNHVPFETNLKGSRGQKLDGTAGTILKEPNPKYFERPGDEIIKGKNNTIIVLGRDFGPSNDLLYSKSYSARQTNSGYSEHMGAGAIDIVAGRMAPFALENVGKDYSRKESEEIDSDLPILKDVVVAPSFNTSFPPELQNTKLLNGDHPGMVMDAARIYISQMTNIDENFKVTQDLYLDSTEDSRIGRTDRKAVVPTSGIMLKADKVRIHSRQDIKIVTGGPNEKYNSQGNRIKQNNGIHLIAENGLNRDGTKIPQQPIPLGDNLIECLTAMCVLLQECVGHVDAVVANQLIINTALTNHFHVTAPGAPTILDPVTKLATISGLIGALKNRFDSFGQDINNFSHRMSYFNPMSEKYINSRYNTTN